MTILLDTHVLLWALTQPQRLSEVGGRLLRDRMSTLVVSAASAWELATKHRLGKLPGADALLASWSEHLGRLGAQELGISTRHALAGGGLVWAHRDPFDRILAAQAATEGLTLLTRDPVFGQVAGVRTLW